jgi:SAM-dependent methyltransferase
VETLYRVMYRLRLTPWERRAIPLALKGVVEEPGAIGVALDLGCGTGANAAFLAQSGWEVVGVDVSPRAIAHARSRSNSVDWRVADITRNPGVVDDLENRVTLFLDVGCLHGLSDTGRRRWSEVAATVTAPNAAALVWAMAPSHARGSLGPRGIPSVRIRALLGPGWAELACGLDPSWHRFRRGP